MYEPIRAFRFWCQKVLPLVYDDSLSYYEVLCKVVDYLNKTIAQMNETGAIVDKHGVQIQQLEQDVCELFQEMEKIKNGEYVDLYLDSIKAWIDQNIQELVAGIVKYVVFGLTTDGYFAAYIPPSWDFIKFDTIMQQGNPLWGHLVLQW